MFSFFAIEVNSIGIQNVEWNWTEFTSAQSLEARMCVIHCNIHMFVDWEKTKALIKSYHKESVSVWVICFRFH